MSTIVDSPPVDPIHKLDWQSVSENLDTQGSAILEHILTSDECESLADSTRRIGSFEAR